MNTPEAPDAKKATKPKGPGALIGVGVALVVLAAGLVFGWPYLFPGDAVAAGFYEGEARREGLAEALKHVDADGWVDYRALKADPKAINAYVRWLAALTPDEVAKWTKPERIAFWNNAYNGLTLKLIIDHYPLNSIKDIPRRWDKPFKVLGDPMTLNHIEHEILRKKFEEPRVHMALVCAARSCPPLRTEPYVGERLDAQLRDQTKKFLGDAKRFRIDRDGKVVHLSQIFAWFGGDFEGKYKPASGFTGDEKQKAVLNFLSEHLPAADAEFLRGGDYRIESLAYDWTLNERK